MPYFLVLSAFVLHLLLQFALLGATASIRVLSPARMFVWRILIGSTAGFLTAHASLIVTTVLPGPALHSVGFDEENWFSDALTGLMVFGLSVGPILASVLGFGLGTAMGIRSAVRTASFRENARCPGTPV